MSIEAMKFARDWIAEKPELRPCSAGKVVSMLTRAIAAAEKAESEKDALLRQSLEALEAVYPYTDQLVDYSSTAAEWPLNRLPENTWAAIEAIRAHLGVES